MNKKDVAYVCMCVCVCVCVCVHTCNVMGFPGGSVGKESACNAGDTGDAGLIPGWGRSLEKAWQPTPVFLPGESQRQGSLVGYSP